MQWLMATPNGWACDWRRQGMGCAFTKPAGVESEASTVSHPKIEDEKSGDLHLKPALLVEVDATDR